VFVALPVIVVLIGSYLWLRSRPHVAPERGGPAVALYQRALEYERVGDDEQALATLDQAIALDPSYQPACLRAAYVAYELEEDQKAAAYLARCKTVEAQDEALRLKAQALSMLLAGNSTGAMQLYQLLIDRYPLDAEAQFRFAELATDLDRVEEADRAVKACLAIESENPYCRFQSMYVKLKENRFDDVLSDYRSLPAGVRDYPWFDEPVAVAFMGKGQLDDATRTFDLLSKRQQQLHGTSHFTAGKEGIADVLLYRGRVNDATRRIQQLMETVDNASSRGDYLAYLAQIYALLGDSRQAAKFAKEAATLPAGSGSLIKAALVLATLGDSEGMERILKVRAGSAHADLSMSNEHLIRGSLAVAKGNTAAGIEEIRLAYDFNPRDEEAAYQLGMAYFRAGDYRAALQMFRAVSDLKGIVLVDNVPLLLPVTTYRIAECYDRLGDPNAAEPFYAEVAKLWAAADDDLRHRVSAPHSKLK